MPILKVASKKQQATRPRPSRDEVGKSKKLCINCQLSTVNCQLSRAFSLIELLVVILIISLLVAAATVSWKNAQVKGRDAKRKADLKSVQQALEYYFNVNGKYPASDSNYKIKCNVGGDNTVKEWGGPFTCNSVIYMQNLPKDPVGTNQYVYACSDANCRIYSLGANLENTNDPERVTCTAGISRTYCVCDPARSTGSGTCK